MNVETSTTKDGSSARDQLIKDIVLRFNQSLLPNALKVTKKRLELEEIDYRVIRCDGGQIHDFEAQVLEGEQIADGEGPSLDRALATCRLCGIEKKRIEEQHCLLKKALSTLQKHSNMDFDLTKIEDLVHILKKVSRDLECGENQTSLVGSVHLSSSSRNRNGNGNGIFLPSGDVYNSPIGRFSHSQSTDRRLDTTDLGPFMSHSSLDPLGEVENPSRTRSDHNISNGLGFISFERLRILEMGEINL